MGDIRRLLINRVAAFVVFLLLIIVINILVRYIDFPFFYDIVVFINNSVVIIGIIALVMVLGEVFMMLEFPLNLLGPISTAIGALLIISFIFSNVFSFLIGIGSLELDIPFAQIGLVISILVFLVIIISGYYGIIKEVIIKHRDEQKNKPHEAAVKEKTSKDKKKKLKHKKKRED